MQSREWPAWYISHIYIYIYTYICYIAYIHIYVQISARIYIYIYTRIQSTSVTHSAKRVPQINESLHTYEHNFFQRVAKTHMIYVHMFISMNTYMHIYMVDTPFDGVSWRTVELFHGTSLHLIYKHICISMYTYMHIYIVDIPFHGVSWRIVELFHGTSLHLIYIHICISMYTYMHIYIVDIPFHGVSWRIVELFHGKSLHLIYIHICISMYTYMHTYIVDTPFDGISWRIVGHFAVFRCIWFIYIYVYLCIPICIYILLIYHFMAYCCRSFDGISLQVSPTAHGATSGLNNSDPPDFWVICQPSKDGWLGVIISMQIPCFRGNICGKFAGKLERWAILSVFAVSPDLGYLCAVC